MSYSNGRENYGSYQDDFFYSHEPHACQLMKFLGVVIVVYLCCCWLDFRRSLVSGLRSSSRRARSAGSFPEQRLVMEPMVVAERVNLLLVNQQHF